MKVTIHPSQLKGIIQAPASKSSMQRALAASLLVKGTTTISNPGHSNDDKAALKVIEAMGVETVTKNEELIINSSGVNPIANEINCGESGLGIRMFVPIIALSEKEITINGEGSLLERPMDFYSEVFSTQTVSLHPVSGLCMVCFSGY